jgi:hypothetical protein
MSRRVRPLLAALLLLASSSHWSCDALGRACTLIGCSSGLSVQLDPALPLPYTVTAVWAEGRASFTCSREGAGARVTPNLLSVFCFSENSFFIGCDQPELASLCRASELELSVAASGAPERRLRVPLQFVPMYPNGRDCDSNALCRQASVLLR